MTKVKKIFKRISNAYRLGFIMYYGPVIKSGVNPFIY